MSKFTPGVWMIDGNGVSVFDERKEATLFIVDNVWAWEDTESEAEANARLIAAAPEMYGELYESLQLLRGKSSYDGDDFAQQAQSIKELLARIDGRETEA